MYIVGLNELDFLLWSKPIGPTISLLLAGISLY